MYQSDMEWLRKIIFFNWNTEVLYKSLLTHDKQCLLG